MIRARRESYEATPAGALLRILDTADPPSKWHSWHRVSDRMSRYRAVYEQEDRWAAMRGARDALVAAGLVEMRGDDRRSTPKLHLRLTDAARWQLATRRHPRAGIHHYSTAHEQDMIPGVAGNRPTDAAWFKEFGKA